MGINFGPPQVEMLVDGARADGTDLSPVHSDPFPCGELTTVGIAGNESPWVLGASAVEGAEGSALPVGDFFEGAIDEVRISSARRDFGGLGD